MKTDFPHPDSRREINTPHHRSTIPKNEENARLYKVGTWVGEKTPFDEQKKAETRL